MPLMLAAAAAPKRKKAHAHRQVHRCTGTGEIFRQIFQATDEPAEFT